ncbi:ribonuclease 3-like [Saccoglossus kowalevskii]
MNRRPGPPHGRSGTGQTFNIPGPAGSQNAYQGGGTGQQQGFPPYSNATSMPVPGSFGPVPNFGMPFRPAANTFPAQVQQGQIQPPGWRPPPFPNFQLPGFPPNPFPSNLNPGLMPRFMLDQGQVLNQGMPQIFQPPQRYQMQSPSTCTSGLFPGSPAGAVSSSGTNQTQFNIAASSKQCGTVDQRTAKESYSKDRHHQRSHDERSHETSSHSSRKDSDHRNDHHHHHHHHHHRHHHHRTSPGPSVRKEESKHHSLDHRKRESHHRSHSSSRERRPDSRHLHREERKQSRRSDDERHHSTPRSIERREHRDHRSNSNTDKKHRLHDRSSSLSPKRSRWEHLEKDNEMRSEDFSVSDSKDKKAVIEEPSKPAWIRCTPMEKFYSADPMDQKNDSTVAGTSKLRDIYDKFTHDITKRAERAKSNLESKIPNECSNKHCTHKVEVHISDSESSSSESGNESDMDDMVNFSQIDNEMRRKKEHPLRLHDELWFNEPGQMNDGPLCKCSYRAKQTGIRHNIYPGEGSIPACDPLTNNAGRLHHYRITVSPPTNFLSDRPTVIEYDEHEYIFEGFSMFSHYPLENFPECNVIRFNIEYTILFLKEPMPENFCVAGLDSFCDFLFEDILELLDFDLKDENGCRRFHFMPRFVRSLPDNGKEVLSMHQVLLYLLRSNRSLVEDSDLAGMLQMEELEWEKIADETKNMIVTCPGKKPPALRIDQLDREQDSSVFIKYPIIVHFGTRPAQLSYAGDPGYQKLFKAYLKMRHLLANRPKVSYEDRQKLNEKEEQLQKMRSRACMKREVTIELSSEGTLRTGIRSDICQHAMMLPVLVHHLRYFACLHILEKRLGYTFTDRPLLKLAMTHPSHHLNFGMNPDHVRIAMSNCGIRQPEYGDRKIRHEHTRKKGINTLINIMSRMASVSEIKSRIHHNERLEFLGDAILEFVTSSHLYFLFPHLEEGGLATYRMALVQNQHLAVLAKKLDLDHYMLYAHGPDLCHNADLRHAMANCFEALMGALYLEAGLDRVKEVFCNLLFDSDDLRAIWMNHPMHPLQQQEPDGDRHLIESSPVLKKLVEFEEITGIVFNHIRLLARSFTQRTVGFTNLTLGHNQRLEFLGDSAMQLVASEYLFKHFPDHHEGHLSLLRSSLVNNRTQSYVAQELGMEEYIIKLNRNREKEKPALRVKVLADLLEAFLGALFVDKNIEWCRVFCEVCFFPRLRDFIMNQDWNDPKSQLQQCCLTLRTEGLEPDIPVYKIVNQIGPSHSRKYTVAVYFKSERLAIGTWSSVQQAEMMAAKNALDNYEFPQLKHQKKFIEYKYKKTIQKKGHERPEKDRRQKSTTSRSSEI